MFKIVDRPIKVAELTDAVSDKEAGATTTFVGTTRVSNQGRQVLRLEYEAYNNMAVEEFGKIAKQAAERWPICRCAIVHRVGIVPVGEASVVIAVSAPHRRESIRACEFLIDRLKEVAPIWKKEFFEGGEVWIGSLADCVHDHGDNGDHQRD